MPRGISTDLAYNWLRNYKLLHIQFQQYCIIYLTTAA